MGRTYKITNGTKEVDLLASGSSGIRPDEGGLGPSRIAPVHNFTDPGAVSGGGVANVKFPLVVDTWRLYIRGTSDDDIASQLKDLIELLRQGWRYHIEPRQNVPVYIETQTTGETNIRYALIYGAPEMTAPDFFDVPFESADLVEHMNIQIVREPFWRSNAPGTPGTALTLAPMWNGKVIVEADFDAVTENGSSTLVDESGDLKFTIDSSQNTVFGQITTSLPDDQDRVAFLFRLDPNTLTMATNDQLTIAQGIGASIGGTTTDWIVDLKKTATGYQIVISIVTDAGATTAGTAFDISDDEMDVLVEWNNATAVAADDGYLKVWVNGILKDSITGVDNDQRQTDTIYFGAVTGIDAGTEGSFYLSSIYWAEERDGAPTRIHVANFRDDVEITHIKQDDGAVFTDLDLGDSLFPAVPAQNDAALWGSTDQPLKTIVIPKLKTAAVITTTTLVLQYSQSAAFAALTLGDDYTVYPGPDLESSLEQNDEDIVLNIKIPSDHAAYSQDSVSAFWIRLIETNASPSWGTIPVLNETEFPYHQRDPVVEIPPGIIGGDVEPNLLMRLISPAGGDTDPTFANISRILIGAKSRGLDYFVSHLNAGGDDNPSEWTATQVTDATATADPQGPGGKHSAVSFSGDSTMQPRVRFTGDDILDSWVGEYRAFIRAQQIGGAAEDTSLLLRTFIGGYGDDDPHIDTAEKDFAAFDDGFEVLDMGIIRIPFARPRAGDVLTGVDVVFEIHAARATGSSTLKIYDLILIPVDEWVVGLDDPISDIDTGSSALRGAAAIDVDGGVIAYRTARVQKIGGEWILSENWARMGKSPTLPDVGSKHRLYFLILNYEDVDASGEFGQAPFFGFPGAQVDFEIYGHMNYLFLRGSD